MEYPKPLIEFKASPNFSVRGPGAKIERIICHTTIGSAKSTLNTFLNPSSKKSAHYLITKKGKIYQFVQLDKRAWHATMANVNSIGIEFESLAGEAMTKEQEAAAVSLIRWLLQKYELPYGCITGHRYATPGNPTMCPNALFGDRSWDSLALWRFKHFAEFK